MNKDNIVWTSVASIVLGLASLFSAFQESLIWAISFGLSALVAATLSGRET